jgi:hypothetical protein
MNFQPIQPSQTHVLAAIAGKVLSGVEYFYLPSTESDEYECELNGIDCMLTAVRLDFGIDGFMLITWSTPGSIEGLSVAQGMPYPGNSYLVHDACKREAWCNHIGTKVVGLGASWQTLWMAALDTLWALRLDFESGSVVVVLGEVNPVLTYIPDEIVVVYDESMARSFRLSDASSSAWGEALF